MLFLQNSSWKRRSRHVSRVRPSLAQRHPSYSAETAVLQDAGHNPPAPESGTGNPSQPLPSSVTEASRFNLALRKRRPMLFPRICICFIKLAALQINLGLHTSDSRKVHEQVSGCVPVYAPPTCQAWPLPGHPGGGLLPSPSRHVKQAVVLHPISGLCLPPPQSLPHRGCFTALVSLESTCDRT